MPTDALLQRTEAKRAEVIALTQDPVRIPTVNPPGDSDAYPRTNVVARYQGSLSGQQRDGLRGADRKRHSAAGRAKN